MFTVILTTIINTILLILAFDRPDIYIKAIAVCFFISSIMKAINQYKAEIVLEDLFKNTDFTTTDKETEE